MDPPTKMLSVLLSATVERVGVSRMRNFINAVPVLNVWASSLQRLKVAVSTQSSSSEDWINKTKLAQINSFKKPATFKALIF